jgi:plasmid stabilization system protein ParE
VATVVHSARALADLERAFESLRAETPAATVAAADAIRSGVESLAVHPLLGHRLHEDIRELVISYGQTGYVALYRFIVPKDEVRILALRHQREIGFIP